MISPNAEALSQEFLQTWARRMIDAARADFNAGPMGANYAMVMQTLDELELEIEHLIFNFVDELD